MSKQLPTQLAGGEIPYTASRQHLCTQCSVFTITARSPSSWLNGKLKKIHTQGKFLWELVVSFSLPRAARGTRCPRGGIREDLSCKLTLFLPFCAQEVFWQCSIPLALLWPPKFEKDAERELRAHKHSPPSPNNDPWWVWRSPISLPVHLRPWGNPHPALLLPRRAGEKGFQRRITAWGGGSFSDSGTPHSGQAHLGSLNSHLPPVPHLLPMAKSGYLGKRILGGHKKPK